MNTTIDTMNTTIDTMILIIGEPRTRPFMERLTKVYPQDKINILAFFKYWDNMSEKYGEWNEEEPAYLFDDEVLFTMECICEAFEHYVEHIHDEIMEG